MVSGESEENEAVRTYFPSFAAHSSAYQTKLTTMQLAIISTTKSFFFLSVHTVMTAHITLTINYLKKKIRLCLSRFGTCKNVIHPQSKLVFDEKAKGVFCCIVDTTDKTRQDLTKLTTTWTDHFEDVC